MKKNRYSIELAVALDEKLEQLAKERGISKVDLIRRALALYALVDEQAKDDNGLAIVNKENEVKVLIALP